MNIRTIALGKDLDLRHYLVEAEKAIDGLSDEELDRLEVEIESSIRRLAKPKPILQLLGSPPPKRKLPKAAVPAFSGILIAALALFFMQTEQQDSTANWVTKGSLESSVVCSLMMVQADRSSPELTDSGFLVKVDLPVFLKTTCLKDLRLEVLENNKWITLEQVDSQDGFLAKNGKLIDLQNYKGKDLRIQSQEGVSEEFVISTGK